MSMLSKALLQSTGCTNLPTMLGIAILLPLGTIATAMELVPMAEEAEEAVAQGTECSQATTSGSSRCSMREIAIAAVVLTTGAAAVPCWPTAPRNESCTGTGTGGSIDLGESMIKASGSTDRSQMKPSVDEPLSSGKSS